MKDYIEILIKSLEKKRAVLDALISENARQTGILDAQPFDTEAFDAAIDKKAQLINELKFLDVGFTSVYERVKETLEREKASHASQIRKIQELIREITQKSTEIEVCERRNDMKFKSLFKNEQQKLRQSKNSVQVATGYYKSMTGSVMADSRFMDQKY